MDIRKYAELNGVVVTRRFDVWYIEGYFWDEAQYQPLPKWKRIGKGEDAAIRNIDKFTAAHTTHVETAHALV